MKELLIFPYSGTAVEALDCLGDEWQCIGFISDDITLIGQEKFGIKIFDRSALTIFSEAKVLAVHGSPFSFLERQKILHSLALDNARYATVIHPKASVGSNVLIGHNVLIMAGVVISANARIGNHIVILPNSVIHHDSIIGDLTLIAANCTIAGNVQIGSNCYIGAASSIKNEIIIGEKVLVGMGANIISPFSSESRVVGNPAKIIKKS